MSIGRFPKTKPGGQKPSKKVLRGLKIYIMHLKKISIQRENFPSKTRYPFCVKSIRDSAGLSFVSPVTFFVGENGSGKSTLLRAIAESCGIHIWEEEITSSLDDNKHARDLYRYIRPEWSNGPKPGSFFAAEHYDHFSKLIEVWADSDPGLLGYFGGKSLLSQSHGESFMSFFSSRYHIEGLYLIDEPETALSPNRQLRFLSFLENAVTENQSTQFIIASHSTILLSCSGAGIFSFNDGVINPISYEDTEHFRVMKEFMGKFK